MKKQSYNYYKNILKDIPPPFMFLDIDALNYNINLIKSLVKPLKIRIASKSIRSVEILKILKNKLGDTFTGIMSYHPMEALHLLKNNFDNILIGYPYLHEGNLEPLIKFLSESKEKKVFFMVDLIKHLDVLNTIANKYEVKLNVCIDVDCSTKYPFLHFGVYRSSLRSKRDLLLFFNKIYEYKKLVPKAIMGYEAQISGVPDKVPKQLLKNIIVRLLKKHSIKNVIKKRSEYVKIFEDVVGYSPEFVNGGGTGSIKYTKKDTTVSEITVGSGFYQPHLFDYYVGNKLIPSVGFGLEVVRNPEKNIYTLSGGGFIASGSIEKSKLPVPWLPEGMKLISTEGAGEVQTPVRFPGELELGSPVFFRHAKAGELAEHFNYIYLIQDGKIVNKVKTYRGENKKFL